ncbi:NAD dependent epimerase/dehydratase family [Geosmithia morbida]|uniref:NAD dependent epimerase/dehydratase family n=1 Tax=Geosmithia morbida TaxID=1094350 RepID=A0A9P5CYR3_9HYPO|nr:NAD dependent epimerase/dehydratase family [Geosmithia morbida]KAF4119672.1 NAD dependent epimerase/dehydratase family [Geosmithia morbida]
MRNVRDSSSLYLAILGRILNGAEIGYGEQGYYLASSGDVVWDDLYDAMARALKTRRVVDDESVVLADDAVLDQMGAAIQRSKEFVPVELGGLCTFTSRNGKNIGWEPEYPADYILQAADEEVDRILNTER